MPGLPDVTLIGTLTADPELRFTANGKAVANFTVAANDRRYDRDAGKFVDGDATFLRCTVWNQQAENMAESLAKGQRVVVTGQLRQRSFETREGDKRTVMELDAREVGASLLFATVKAQKTGRGAGGGGGGSAPADDPWGAAPPAGAGAAAAVDDEPPF